MNIVGFKTLPNYITTNSGVYPKGSVIKPEDPLFEKIKNSEQSYNLPGEDKSTALYEAIVEGKATSKEKTTKVDEKIEVVEPEEDSQNEAPEGDDSEEDETEEEESSDETETKPKRRKRR